ncbi:MAG: AAA family ATPase, partial [Chloroflexi bacterium]|nr:AAA family ATPase [Chloroflexota bacterium]
MTSATDVFVGRESEMAELTTAFHDAFSGQGRLVMLVGEPGIGKTRTAEELAAVAVQRNARVLWGRCPEDAGAPPFWPWVQIVRAYSDVPDPALGAQIPDSPSPAGKRDVVTGDEVPISGNETVDLARFRLFESYSAFLKHASGSRPLVVVFDNLHWADSSSLQLLEFVTPDIAGLPVLVLGTYRDVEIARGNPLFRSLGELARHRHFRRIMLRGLDLDHVGAIVEGTGLTKPSRRLLERIHANTEGNPFFAREVVALLKDEAGLATAGLAAQQSGAFRVPEGVKEAIGRRLDKLSQHC